LGAVPPNIKMKKNVREHFFIKSKYLYSLNYILINMKERNKILLLSVIVSVILTYFIAICILASTAPQHEKPFTIGSGTMLMQKIKEGSMPGHKFFHLDILAVISLLLFVGLLMVFYVVIKHILEGRK
jgi:hypothetical protein